MIHIFIRQHGKQTPGKYHIDQNYKTFFSSSFFPPFLFVLKIHIALARGETCCSEYRWLSTHAFGMQCYNVDRCCFFFHHESARFHSRIAGDTDQTTRTGHLVSFPAQESQRAILIIRKITLFPQRNGT